ncbi:ATP-binding cassette domain-containing protein [Gluconacetobacter azotocaptans]|uniref:ATP-binding cassette domain-containing protein n=1 Tax=Gluconacetobacter azotocaptans TaxID=142834 RepID=A0A7W4PGU9_9PROT|nr:ATP-binding cassette domain-containing protein [Gluconacetobacter azotocaptans]MBB2190381.1 ATP-binding cassette domain-containing protein [Gluconacetobacter azotocaptans]GBQ30091.1 molybdenum ABC transporter ATP-binding protein ModC [Gluconacetobacter azotocaptans DSM 13594]
MTRTPRDLTVMFQGRLQAFRCDLAFTVPGHGVTALTGPSGCGKTTILRAIAGLHRFDNGFCALGDEVWQKPGVFVPPHRRSVGYVFQEPSLLPHLSVRQNLLYGARARAGMPTLEEITSVLGLAGLLHRRPTGLSGGEQQRVAIGRALLAAPAFLLLDEPVSALDRDRKNTVVSFLKRLPIPILYVSHDSDEILEISSEIIRFVDGFVIRAGRSGPDATRICQQPEDRSGHWGERRHG